MVLKQGTKRVLVISDLQEPYAHKDALPFVKAVKLAYKTDVVVVIGDEVDFPGLSRFPQDPDGKSAGDDHREAVKALKKWYKEFPEASVCTSNHTDRIFRRAFSAGIPRDFIKTYREFLGAPDGWMWEDSYFIDGVKYEHGDNQGGQDACRQLAIANRCSTVIGHHHSHGGLRYIANDNDVIFGLNVGCLIDRHAYVFKYGKGAKFKPTLGCGVVLKGVPSFVPLILDKNERWIRKLIV